MVWLIFLRQHSRGPGGREEPSNNLIRDRRTCTVMEESASLTCQITLLSCYSSASPPLPLPVIVWVCVCVCVHTVCPSNKRAVTVSLLHTNCLRWMLTTYIQCAWRNSTQPKSNFHQPCSSVQQTGFGLWVIHHWESSSSTHYHISQCFFFSFRVSRINFMLS